MASFNFDKFETEYETRQLLGQFANILRELRAPGNNGQRLIPADEGDPLHTLMGMLRVNQEAPPEEFDFELGNILTIQEAGNRCSRAGAHMPDMVNTVANRVYFNVNLDRHNPDWIEISRPEALDPGAELQVCQFLNKERTIIDWRLTLTELKRLAQNRLYTPAMMRVSLGLMVDKFAHHHKDLIKDLNANQVANYLLSMEKNRDKASYRRRELLELCRQPDQDLRAPLVVAERLIDQIYPADRPELAAQRSQAKRMAIVSFLPDELALPLLRKIKLSMEHCTPLTDESILHLAMEAEEVSRIYPTFPLKFGRQIGALPAANHIQFNSVLCGNVAPTNYYGLPVTAYGNPYLAYPSILPPEDRRIRQPAPPAPPGNQAAAPQQQAAQVAAGLPRQLTAVQADVHHPPAHGTPENQAPPQQSGTPLRLPGGNEVNTPFPTPSAENSVNSVRRNILAEACQILFADNPSETSDLSMEDSSESWTQVLGKGRKSSTPLSYASAVKTRAQSKAAMAAELEEGQIELSSINLQQPLTSDVMSLAIQLAEAVKNGQNSPASGSNADQSYKRGHVRDGRYTSQDRDQSSRGQDHYGRTPSRDRDQFKRDRSRDRDSSQRGDQSYRGQSRGRYPSRDRTQSSRDSRYPSQDRYRQNADPRSRSGERSYERPQSRGQDSRSYRDQSKDRSYSRNGSQSYIRTQSRSPARSSGSTQYSSGNRPSRAFSQDRSSRSSSYDLRSIYKKMERGENCREDYDPRKEKECRKCTSPGHHEFECRTYKRYNTKKCSICKKCNHFADECRATEKFPPNVGGNSAELEKN